MTDVNSTLIPLSKQVERLIFNIKLTVHNKVSLMYNPIIDLF